MSRWIACGVAALMSAGAGAAGAFEVVIDYSFDTGGLSDNPTIRDAVNAAADEVSRVITTHLGALDLTQTQHTATVGGANATVTRNAAFIAVPEVINGAPNPYTALAENQYVVFFGSANIGGYSGLGNVGLSAGTEIIGGSIANADFPAALQQAMTQSNDVWRRGPDVPNVMGYDWGNTLPSLSGIVSDGSPTFGGITLNTSKSWSSNDAYTTALHEILHTLGFSQSAPAFIGNIGENGEWLGEHARALNGGSGFGILDGSHLSASLSSPRITDGALQEPVMAAMTLAGVRYEMTEMDVAILRDMGYQIVPEPGAIAILAVAGIMALRRRSRMGEG